MFQMKVSSKRCKKHDLPWLTEQPLNQVSILIYFLYIHPFAISLTITLTEVSERDLNMNIMKIISHLKSSKAPDVYTIDTCLIK